MEAAFCPLGDGALLVTLGQEVSEEINDLVLAACSALEESRVPGIIEAQPAYSSFCVHFDRSRVRASYIEGFTRELLRRLAGSLPGLARRSGRLVQVPVLYGGEEGPDLQWASERLGMSPETIVKLHSGRDYRVYMLGFTPGFPYLGGIDERIALERLPEPRKRVPAGSVGIAGNQTGIYPWDSPGGWRIIGRTRLELFSPLRDDPSLLHPGDTIRFVPVDRDDRRFNPPANAPETAHGQTPGHANPAPLAPHSVPGFTIENPGFLTLVVDGGRHGYRKLGVPVSGAADLVSYKRANMMCGNPPYSPALEMTLLGARIRAETSLTVSIAGAPAPAFLNGDPVDTTSPLLVPKGSVLEIGSMPTGCRAYLAVAGGISVEKVMGSASTYLRGRFGGFAGRPLRAGDVVRVGPSAEHEEILPRVPAGSMPLPEEYQSVFSGTGEVVLGIIPGPEGHPDALRALCGGVYSVRPESDRMGLRFDGPTLAGFGGDILSSPVVPGTIQVPSDGSPLLLTADAQTTGGYKRIAVLESKYLGVAGQLRPGAKVRFAVRRPV